MPDEPSDDVLFDYLDVYHAAAIARAISAWAKIEFEIDEFIWQLAQLEPNVGACLTTQFPGVVARMNALISLARQQKVNKARIGRLNKFKTLATALADERNRLVHDPWLFGYNSKKLYRLHKTAREHLEYEYKVVTEAELTALEARMSGALDRLRDLRREILHAFWSSP